MTKPIPEGYTSLTPSFTFKDSRKAIEFYKKAFDAKELDIFPNLNGQGIMHATIQIGNSIIMMGDENPDPKCPKSAETTGQSPITMFIYVTNVDEVFKQAINAGSISIMPVADMFWGDRCGQIKDPFGYSWMIATHIKDLSQEQMQKGAEAFFAQMAKG